MNQNESGEQPFVARREPAGDLLHADPVEEEGGATGAGPAGDKARRPRSANEGTEQAVGGSLLQRGGLAMGSADAAKVGSHALVHAGGHWSNTDQGKVGGDSRRCGAVMCMRIKQKA
jgi:hypothetical protein